MIYNSIQSPEYLRYLILREKKENTKTHPNTSFLHFYGQNNNLKATVQI